MWWRISGRQNLRRSRSQPSNIPLDKSDHIGSEAVTGLRRYRYNTVLRKIDHLIGTSALAPQCPMVKYTRMGTEGPGPHATEFEL
ncbi:hypothetical protein TNCV_1522661 [Trichonephila clavipes]|nr:hypothetical protein TNCV_1522661 [Trichonephila clavipes]